NFGEKPEFIALGERIRHPFLEATIAQIGGEIFPGDVVVTNLLLTRVPGHDFVHGGCTVNGHLANVIYFEDVALGLLAVCMPPPSAETRLARFSGRRMPRPGGPSVN